MTHLLSDLQPLIDVRELTKSYRVGPTVVEALRGVSLRIWPGEFVGVVGPSGSGKSTLLNLLAGVDRLTSGEVLIGGRAVQRMPEAELARWRSTNLGIVFQFFQMLPTMTLLNNVMLPMELARRYTPAERRIRAAQLLERVGLQDHLHKLPGRVSGGQQQRAAIARANANDPSLIFGDEPTGRQDPRFGRGLLQPLSDVGRYRQNLPDGHPQPLARRPHTPHHRTRRWPHHP